MTINIRHFGYGKPIVLFHGWGFDSSIWQPLVPLLQTHYQLLLVDLPGFGETSLMDWDTFKTTLCTLLPNDACTFIGWSLGGLFATRFSIEVPERVHSLINVTSTPHFLKSPSWPGVSKEIFDRFYQNLSVNPSATLQEFIRLQMNNVAVDTPSSDSLTTLPSKRALQLGLDILQSWDLREALYSVKSPVSYLFGRLDPITPVPLMQTMQKKYPHFNYVMLPKAAHMPFLSHPKEFIQTTGL